MTLRLLTLLLITLAGTSGRAQTDVSLAFIKGGTGFLIDSISVSTTLDPLPYGFAFQEDTLLLDVTIFAPVDQLTIETFGAGHSFGPVKCWVDGPTANVHLSVDSGRNLVDSVGLSPVHTWYVNRLGALPSLPEPLMQQRLLLELADQTYDNLMSAGFIEYYLRQPYTNPMGARYLSGTLLNQPGAIRQHPWVKELRGRVELLARGNPLKANRYNFEDPAGTPASLRLGKKGFTVLSFYRTGPDAYPPEADRAREEHRFVERKLMTDSLFQNITFVGVSRDASGALWQLYQRDEKFSWRHYREMPRRGRVLSDILPLFPQGPTYLLLTREGAPIGVYPSLQLVANSIKWRLQRASKP